MDPAHPEWEDVPCPACDGSGDRIFIEYATTPTPPNGRARFIKTKKDCELCEGHGVVSPSLRNDYRRDPLGTLARRAAR